MSETGPGGARVEAIGSRRLQWYMAVVLCLSNSVAFIDRASMPLLVQQIEHDLGINDTQMSLLIGFAFILAYSGCAIPAGMIVDRFSRRKVLAGGIGFWALATMFCGAATSFGALFVGRFGVGAGESVGGPAAMSLIKEGIAPSRRGRAVATWAMGAGIGAGTALLGGGALLHLIGDAPSVTVPLLGEVRSWQLVLICSGLIAIPVGLLALSLPEPPRQRAATHLQGGGQTAGLGQALRFMARKWPVFLPLFLVNGASIIMTYSYQIWMPALLGRVWHLSRPEIGLNYGLIVLLVSTSSQFTAGLLMDRLARSGARGAIPAIGLAVALIVLIPGIVTPFMPTLGSTWLMLALFAAVQTCMFTVGTAAMAQLAPPAMVGKITSLHFAWVGITGTAVGPTTVAFVSDTFFSGPNALGSSISCVVGTLDLVAIVCFALLLVQFRRGAAVPTEPAGGISPGLPSAVGSVR